LEDVAPDELSYYVFNTQRLGHPDYSQYRGADTEYVEPLPWLTGVPHEPFCEGAAKESPEDEDLDYEPMEDEDVAP
jgi:hypothetical protein